ncbi:MAG TPA: sigma-54 dependent transcriptional regulator [Polyangiaceae bacterium]|nr:sigma-54 dependent transcriptional regulator [Polyangiaceae bacterium]
MTTRVLIVDERGALSPRVESAVRRRFDLASVTTPADVKGEHFDVAVIAPRANDQVALCKTILESRLASQVVFLGADPSLQDAIRAIRAGASDFVPDGSDPEAVIQRVTEVAELAGLRAELQRLREGVPPPSVHPDLIGQSPAMERLRDRLRRIGGSDVTVLISGESGGGKEIVARILHTQHGTGPFVAVSCSAIPRHLMESEFFGHARGAFTGASGDRTGLLLQASGGTVFLDEIGDMPLELQAKLLRALQQRTVRPLGQREEVRFDARVMAATSRDLEKEVSEGRFRQDLYFRLNVIRVSVPPLRERGGDILLLAQHFIQRSRKPTRPIVGMTPAAARAMLAYSWPGNVRELEHCILSAVAVARYDHITVADLPIEIGGSVAPQKSEVDDLVPLHELERLHILETLRSVGGNKALASRFLGLDRKTLYRKLRAYAEASGETPPAREAQDSYPDTGQVP